MMLMILRLFPLVLAAFGLRSNLVLGNLALRQQLAIMPRPRHRRSDPVFWLLLSRAWLHWKETLVIVNPSMMSSGRAAHCHRRYRHRSRSFRISKVEPHRLSVLSEAVPFCFRRRSFEQQRERTARNSGRCYVALSASTILLWEQDCQLAR